MTMQATRTRSRHAEEQTLPLPPAPLQREPRNRPRRTRYMLSDDPLASPYRRRITRAFWRRVNNPSPTLKQSSITVLSVLAVVVTLALHDAKIQFLPALVAGLESILLASVLAIVFTWRRRLARFEHLIPAIDFFAIEAIRFGMGGTKSIIGLLVVVPVIWMSGAPGRRYIVFAVAGVALVFVLPVTIAAAQEADPTALPRAVFSILVYGVVATIINDLSRQSRLQVSRVRAREAAITQELVKGAEVQQALLPRNESPAAGYEVAGRCIPAKVVGGDFYDWYPTADGMGITLGDVMGKGVGAGIIAATAHAVVRSARLDPDPVTAVIRTDTTLSTELVGVGSFTTMFHARLRSADGRLQYSDAGHGLTVLVRADGTWERLAEHDLPLGLSVSGTWSAHERTLDPGDMLVIFSDGVLDLYDGTLMAVDNVAQLAVRAGSAAGVVEAVSTLAQGATSPDDVTIVAIRRAATE